MKLIPSGWVFEFVKLGLLHGNELFKRVQYEFGMDADLLNTMVTRLQLMNDPVTYSINPRVSFVDVEKAPAKETNFMF